MADLSKFEHVEHEKLRRLLAYWLDLRGDNAVPLRSQLDPIAIPWVLSYIWLMQLDREVDRFRYRLAGESIQDMYDQNLTGKTIFDLMDEEIAKLSMRSFTAFARNRSFVTISDLSIPERTALALVND